MVEEEDKYLYKRQELIDALTNEVTELYSAKETLETKLDRILGVISNEPNKVEEIKFSYFFFRWTRIFIPEVRKVIRKKVINNLIV